MNKILGWLLFIVGCLLAVAIFSEVLLTPFNPILYLFQTALAVIMILSGFRLKKKENTKGLNNGTTEG